MIFINFFLQPKNANEHVAVYSPKHIYRTGFFNPKSTLFEMMIAKGANLLAQHEQCLDYPWMVVFDTESTLNPLLEESQLDTNDHNFQTADIDVDADPCLEHAKRTLEFLHRHEVNMIALSQNIVEPKTEKFTIDPNYPHRFLFDFIRKLLKYSDICKARMDEQVKPIKEIIAEDIVRIQSQYGDNSYWEVSIIYYLFMWEPREGFYKRNKIYTETTAPSR
jgi:hypothetical protein